MPTVNQLVKYGRAKEQNRTRYWKANDTNKTYKIFPEPEKEDELLTNLNS